MIEIAKLPLNSNKYPGLFAYVDSRFADELSQFNWYPKKQGLTFYAKRNVQVSGKRTNQFLHREVLQLAGIQVPTGMVTDHRDGCTLNNCVYNLRVVSRSQNTQNKRTTGASRYLGVCLNRTKWQAYVQVNGKKQHLGCFANEIDAALAYDQAIKEYFDEPKLNFPDSRFRIIEGLLFEQPLTLAGCDRIVAGIAEQLRKVG